MNGVHDMGGMHCFGPVDPDPNGPMFHADWEKRVLVMVLAMGASGTWNLDESRSVRETLPPDYYLSAGYYKIWLLALERLLVKHKLVTPEELSSGEMKVKAKALARILIASEVGPAMAKGSPVDRTPTSPASFKVGDRVRVCNFQPEGHTRLPAYIRGQAGIVHRVHGCHIYADSHAAGEGESPKWLYNIQFDSSDLWGKTDTASIAGRPDSNQTGGSVHVDCWEPYLDAN